MKKQLKVLKRGERFTNGADEYIVLEHTDSEHTKVITAGIVCKKAFDEENRNDFASSTLMVWLASEYAGKSPGTGGEESP